METEKKEIYRGKALLKLGKKETLIALLCVALFYLVVFFIAGFFPFSWVLELGAIIVSAIYLNKIMKNGTFTRTYILYEDELVVVTKYGLIEKISDRYDLEKTEFTENTINCDGRIVEFFPDEKLKKLLNL